MADIVKSIEVECPLRTVYNQWTQFEEFPRFMEGIKEVKQLDATHLSWHANIGGKDVTWEAEITEQLPDERISWRSTTGAPNAGTVRFDRLPSNRTSVTLAIHYDPAGVVENVGDALGVTAHRIEGDLNRFKDFIENRGAETGQWRGEVHHGQFAPSLRDGVLTVRVRAAQARQAKRIEIEDASAAAGNTSRETVPDQRAAANERRVAV